MALNQCEKAELHSLEKAFKLALLSEKDEVFRVNTCRGLLGMRRILIEGGGFGVLVTVVGSGVLDNG